MSIFLYQIGMDRITATPTSFVGLQVNLPRSFKVDVSQSARSSEISFSNIMQMPEQQEVELTGTFMCSGCESVSDQFNRLLSMSGRPHVDFIGYLPNDCCCTSESCGKCGNCSGDKPVTWLTTTGVITSIERAYTVDRESPYPGSMMEVNFKMILDTYWYPLNPYIWYAQNDGSIPYDSFHKEDELTKSILPIAVLPGSNFSFYKRTYSYQYELLNPTIFPSIYSFEDGVGKDYFTLPDGKWRYRVRPPRTRWAAPPASIYMFRPVQPNSNQIANIKITVESEIAPFRTLSFVSNNYPSESSVNANSDSFHVVISEGIYGPVYAIPKDPSTLSSFTNDLTVHTMLKFLADSWVYPNDYPGQLLGIDNYVTIETDNPESIEVAYLHTFRTL